MSSHTHPIVARFGQILISLILICATVWGSFALWYQFPSAELGKITIIIFWISFGGFTCWRLWNTRPHGQAFAAFSIVFVVLLGWWSTIKPSNHRDWADEVSQVVQAHVKDNQVTLDHVRNFNWYSETQHDSQWDTRQYDLNQLVSADLILSYWMGPKIAHTLVSFGFNDGSHVVFSLEIRKERNESFSAIGGFFRKFEAIMIAADERDIVRVRTNIRGEQVYLYRLNVPQKDLRMMFLNYADEANALANKPSFYNTLISNCTTIVYDLAKLISTTLPLDYRIFLSGYLGEYAYDTHLLTPNYSFQTLQQRGHMNARAIAAGNNPQFSTLIRQGVPGITQARGTP